MQTSSINSVNNPQELAWLNLQPTWGESRRVAQLVGGLFAATAAFTAVGASALVVTAMVLPSPLSPLAYGSIIVGLAVL